MLTGIDSLDLSLVWVPATGGASQTVTPLRADQHGNFPFPVAQVYFTSEPRRIHVGLASVEWSGLGRRVDVPVAGTEDSWEPAVVAGVLSPDRRRALIVRKYTLFEAQLAHGDSAQSITIDVDRVGEEGIGRARTAVHRLGPAFAPWISWSADGSRVLFSQGGTLFLGTIRGLSQTAFERIDVPLMVPRDAPRGIFVLSGARLITMRGPEVIDPGTVVVEGKRIVAVGPAGDVVIPPAARVMDVSGMTILPGYVDVHDHMVLPRGVHSQECWQCLTTLALGVTAVRDPQPAFANDVFAYREREAAGALLSPRVFSTGMAYFGADPPITTPEDARAVVRPYADYFGSETFKVHYDAASGRHTRQLLAIAAAEEGLNATVHGQGLETELTAAFDGFSGLEHAPQVRFYDDVAALLAASDITHTLTYGAAIYGSWNYLARRDGGPELSARMRRFVPPAARRAICAQYAANPWFGPPELDQLFPLLQGARRIVAQGGRVAMGSHGNIPGLGPHYEMWLYALGGMANHDVLRSATLVGATAIGHATDFGSLEPGKLADLQVLDKNPLIDIRNSLSVRFVMKNGRLFTADDLTEIWPRHRPLPQIYVRADTLSPQGPGVQVPIAVSQHRRARPLASGLRPQGKPSAVPGGQAVRAANDLVGGRCEATYR